MIQQGNYQTFILSLLIMKDKTIFTLFVRKSFSENYLDKDLKYTQTKRKEILHLLKQDY